MAPKSVYIHIPFCTNKCHYCDFTAYVVKGQPVEDYLTAVELEIEQTVTEIPPEEIETIFIGGGTPTILTPIQMERLLQTIRKYFPKTSSNLEFTVEANPGTTNPELLHVMKKEGVNRLSIGAQTFRSDLLQKIGRIHDVKEIEDSVRDARRIGFSNVSLDLMFGLPQQKISDMRNTLDQAVALEPDHFSCYSLKVEEGTWFYQLYEKGKLPLPSEEDEFTMYQMIRSYLRDHGYEQYEISNFSRPGKESQHNSTYWLNMDYYGIGAGAHGYTNGIRHMNVKGISQYIEKSKHGERPIADIYPVSREESMENFMILGLRLLDGVNIDRFNQIYGVSLWEVFGSTIEQLLEKNLLKMDARKIFLTETGILFGNEVFASFL